MVTSVATLRFPAGICTPAFMSPVATVVVGAVGCTTCAAPVEPEPRDAIVKLCGSAAAQRYASSTVTAS